MKKITTLFILLILITTVFLPSKNNISKINEKNITINDEIENLSASRAINTSYTEGGYYDSNYFSLNFDQSVFTTAENSYRNENVQDTTGTYKHTYYTNSLNMYVYMTSSWARKYQIWDVTHTTMKYSFKKNEMNTFYLSTDEFPNGFVMTFSNVMRNHIITVKRFPEDKITATGLSTIYNKPHTNQDVTLTSVVEGKTKTETYSVQREHTFSYYNKYNNIKNITFTIDKTPPKGTLNGVTNGGFTNQDVTFTWNDTASATLNGNTYNSGDVISNEGFHTIVLTDRAGNTTTYTFTIDKTPPVGTLNGVTNGGITNQDVRFTWNDAATATLNGKNYISGSKISADNYYELVLTDLAGNKTTYTFTIDKTPPVGTLNGVTNGGITNNNVTFSWNSNQDSKATLNGSNYNSNSSITQEGYYELVLTDAAGNITTYTFTIDKTPPVGTLNGVTNGGYTNKNITFTWNDTATATLNGNTYNSGDVISNEGFHTIVLTDLAGNTTVYTFTIDKTPPVFNMYSGASSIYDGAITNNNVYFRWNDSGSTMKVYKDSKFYTDYYLTYYMYSKEYNSNLSVINNNLIFLNRNDAINYIISKESKLVSPYYYTNQGEYEVYQDDKNYAYVNNTYTLHDNYIFVRPETLNNYIISQASAKNLQTIKDHQLKESGKYSVELTDLAGNTTIYTFTIDKIPPEGVFTGVNNEGITNKNVTFNWIEDNVTATLNEINYNSGNVISDEGIYTIILKDFVGNTTIYTFEIDKTPPVGTLVGVTSGGITNQDVKFTWNDAATATLNGINYSRNTTIFEEGYYEIVLTDLAGNTTTYTFTIDKTPPEFDLRNLSNFSVEKEDRYFNFDLYLFWNETDVIATLNGSSYSKNNVISSEGNYKFTLKDQAGNITTYEFEIDKTPPVINYNQFLQDGSSHINTWYETYSYTFNGYYRPGTYYSFATFESARRFSLIRENDTVETGIYNGGSIYSNLYNSYVEIADIHNASLGSPYFIYKDKNDQNKPLAYFNNSLLEEVKTHYVNQQIEQKYIPNIPATPFEGELIFGDIIYFTKAPSFRNKDNTIKIYLNNVLTSYTQVELSFEFGGLFSIIEEDLAGNQIHYSIGIDKTPPQFRATDLTGLTNNAIQNMINEQTIIKITERIRIRSFDIMDANSILIVVFNRKTTIIYNDYYEFSQSGIYEFYSIDKAGNKTEVKTLELSLEEIKHSFEELLDEDYKVAGFIFRYDNVINPNVISQVIVNFRTSLDVPFERLTIDGDNNIINNNNSEYTFYTSGYYEFIIIDSFGRTINLTRELWRDKPNGYLWIVDPLDRNKKYIGQNNSVINWNFYFSWSDLNPNYRALLIDENGVETIYLKNTPETRAGKWIIRLYDVSDPLIYLDYHIEIDITPPTGNLFIVGLNEEILTSPNFRTNQDVKFIWDNNIQFATATLNGIPYTSGQLITNQGIHTIILTDQAGNTSTYKFEIDKTPPEAFITTNGIPLSNNSITNNIVKISWDKFGVKATLNGDPYKKNTNIYNDGVYSLILTDETGNESFYTFTIDTVKPEGTLSGVTNGGHTNQDVSFSWKEKLQSLIINGKIIDLEKGNNLVFKNEGYYNILITDLAGNTTTYTFTIDKTPPEGTLNGVINGGVTNNVVTFNWSESELTVTLNGDSYTKNKKIYEQGYYEIVLTDFAGNTTTYTFIIDTTFPSGTLNGVINGGVTNKVVTFTWYLDDILVTLNGATYTKLTEITAEGYYEIVLKNPAGNTTVYTFTIDKTPPEGTLNGVANGGITNKDVSFSWTEDNVTATLNETLYRSGREIYLEGYYELVLTDAAGNITTYTFTIDKTSPVGTLNGVTNGGITNKDVSFSWTEDNVTATLNGINYLLNTVTSGEGYYELVLKDRAGNTTVYTFTIDKTPPEGTLNGVTNGGYTNKDVSFSWTEDNVTATLNDDLYLKNKKIYDEGYYEIVLKDRAGNTTVYTFTIDKTPPEGTLNGVTNGGYTNKDVTFTWGNDEYSATINDEVYYKNFIISEEGYYEIILTNQAGNTSVYSFTIDKTPPEGTLSGVTNGGITNKDVTFTWENDNYSATLNGNLYKKNTYIYNNDFYTLVLTDLAGNKTTYTFTIFKILPEGTLNGVTNGGYTNKDVTFTWENDEYSATINDEIYYKNFIISEEGYYEIVLTDLAGNTTVYTFTIDKTPPEGTYEGINEHGVTNTGFKLSWEEDNVTATINDNTYRNNSYITAEGYYEIVLTDLAGNKTTYKFEIDKTSPVGTLNGVANGGITNQDVSFSWIEDEEDIEDYEFLVLLNGEVYIRESKITEEGYYELVLIDLAGNESFYSFEIDKTPPEGTLIGVTNGGYTNQDVRFTWEEEPLEVFINEQIYRKNNKVTEEGYYEIVLTDLAGNKTIYTFTIDRTPPVGTLIGVTNGGYTNQDVTFIWDDELYYLESGDYNSGDILTEEGYYSFKLFDYLGNDATYSFTIDKTPPKVTFEGIDILSTDKTNNTVRIRFEKDIISTLNGSDYSSGSPIRNDGVYFITFSDLAGNKLEYNFSIKTRIDNITYENLKTNKILNSISDYISFPVRIHSTDSIVVNGQNFGKEDKLEKEGTYKVTITDEYGNVFTKNITIEYLEEVSKEAQVRIWPIILVSSLAFAGISFIFLKKFLFKSRNPFK